jgi:hypothetical protein
LHHQGHHPVCARVRGVVSSVSGCGALASG